MVGVGCRYGMPHQSLASWSTYHCMYHHLDDASGDSSPKKQRGGGPSQREHLAFKSS